MLGICVAGRLPRSLPAVFWGLFGEGERAGDGEGGFDFLGLVLPRARSPFTPPLTACPFRPRTGRKTYAGRG